MVEKQRLETVAEVGPIDASKFANPVSLGFLGIELLLESLELGLERGVVGLELAILHLLLLLLFFSIGPAFVTLASPVLVSSRRFSWAFWIASAKRV